MGLQLCIKRQRGKICEPSALCTAIWSKIFPQIFNLLVAVFDFTLRNLPESILEGRITNKGRGVKYYFEAFGSLAVLFVEFTREIGTAKERLNAIAQVIAECDDQPPFGAQINIFSG